MIAEEWNTVYMCRRSLLSEAHLDFEFIRKFWADREGTYRPVEWHQRWSRVCLNGEEDEIVTEWRCRGLVVSHSPAATFSVSSGCGA